VNVNDIVTLAAGGFILVGGAASLLGQTRWVQDRPGYARLVKGVQLAAGRLSMAIPPGTTAAQAANLVAQEAVGVAVNYVDSAKVSGASQAAIGSMIAGELGHILPPGHIVPGSAADGAAQLIADIRAQLALAAPVPAVVPVPAGLAIPPVPVV
jgi:hypothetical protein